MLLIFSVSIFCCLNCELFLFFSFHFWMLNILKLLLLLLFQREIDYSVAQIFKTLKSLGLLNDTLVFFTSDNGSVHLKQSLTHPGITSVFELSLIFLISPHTMYSASVEYFLCVLQVYITLLAKKHLLYWYTVGSYFVLLGKRTESNC